MSKINIMELVKASILPLISLIVYIVALVYKMKDETPPATLKTNDFQYPEQLQKLKNAYYKYRMNNYYEEPNRYVVGFIKILLFLMVIMSFWGGFVFLGEDFSKYISPKFLAYSMSLMIPFLGISFYVSISKTLNIICVKDNKFIIGKDKYEMSDISYIRFYYKFYFYNEKKNRYEYNYVSTGTSGGIRRVVNLFITIKTSNNEIKKYDMTTYSKAYENVLLLAHLAKNNELSKIPKMTAKEYEEIYEEVYLNE